MVGLDGIFSGRFENGRECVAAAVAGMHGALAGMWSGVTPTGVAGVHEGF